MRLKIERVAQVWKKGKDISNSLFHWRKTTQTKVSEEENKPRSEHMFGYCKRKIKFIKI